MLLSDGDLRKELEAGRLVLEPWDPVMLQPSSIDVRLDRYFRVFQNSRYTHIDPAQQQDELTSTVEPDGDDPFVLHPGEFVLGSTFESVSLPDDLAGRLEGKALAVDTPVPTPDGWRAMGDLRPGDRVFGIDGRSTLVIATTVIMRDRPCFEVCFSDDQSIIADAAHRWLTRTRNAPTHAGAAALVTTAEIADDVRAGNEYRHHIGLAAGLMDSSGPIDEPGGRDRGALALRTDRARVRDSSCQNAQLADVAITAVRPVASRPVRCIQVAAPDGMFLAGPTFIPTHNSSLGRLGLLTHSTAGFIDPGFTGHITLELSNVANLPITLWPGMKIGQLCLFRLSSPAERPYGSTGVGSRYQGQRGPTPSRAHLNFHRVDTRR